MEKEFTNGVMGLLTMEIGILIKYRATENIFGMMAEFMKDNGFKITW